MHPNGQQPNGQQPVPAPMPMRRASPERIIGVLNERLDEKANHIRRLEDSEVALGALVVELTEENRVLVEECDRLRAQVAELEAAMAPEERSADEATPERNADADE